MSVLPEFENVSTCTEDFCPSINVEGILASMLYCTLPMQTFAEVDRVPVMTTTNPSFLERYSSYLSIEGG